MGVLVTIQQILEEYQSCLVAGGRFVSPSACLHCDSISCSLCPLRELEGEGKTTTLRKGKHLLKQRFYHVPPRNNW